MLFSVQSQRMMRNAIWRYKHELGGIKLSLAGMCSELHLLIFELRSEDVTSIDADNRLHCFVCGCSHGAATIATSSKNCVAWI